MNLFQYDWLSVLNQVYSIEAEDLVTFQSLFSSLMPQMVHVRTSTGGSWAHYDPFSGRMIGNNGHIIAQKGQQDLLWWGEEFRHQNPPNNLISKGDWYCSEGLLKNRLGSTLMVCGILPKSVIRPFLTWQPGAAKYGGLAGDHARMRALFEEERNED